MLEAMKEYARVCLELEETKKLLKDTQDTLGIVESENKSMLTVEQLKDKFNIYGDFLYVKDECKEELLEMFKEPEDARV